VGIPKRSCVDPILSAEVLRSSGFELPVPEDDLPEVESKDEGLSECGFPGKSMNPGFRIPRRTSPGPPPYSVSISVLDREREDRNAALQACICGFPGKSMDPESRIPQRTSPGPAPCSGSVLDRGREDRNTALQACILPPASSHLRCVGHNSIHLLLAWRCSVPDTAL